MSASAPFEFTGTYTHDSLGRLLRAIQEQQHSGLFSATTASAGRTATIHFIQGKLAAAEFGGLGGVSALQELIASQAGTYDFKLGFVQLSQIAMDKRIQGSLEGLLTSLPTSNLQTVAAPSPVNSAAAKIPQPSLLEAFDFDALIEQPRKETSRQVTMQPGFVKQLLAEFVRGVGPAARVLLEEIALDLDIDLQAITFEQAENLGKHLLTQVPVNKRNAFQSSCAGYLAQFKP